MKYEFQATGYAPRVIEGEHIAHSQQMLDGDKRGVSLNVFKEDGMGVWGVLTYLTTWPTERQFVRVFRAPHIDAASLSTDSLASQLREAAKTMLPPGAGYPAMPQYETRQSKLAGMLETATLVCISHVLADVARSG